MRNVVLITLPFIGKLLLNTSLEDGVSMPSHSNALNITYNFLFDLLLAHQTSPNVVLVKGGLGAYMIVLQSKIVFGFALLLLERVPLALNESQTIQLLRAVLRQAFHLNQCFVDWTLVLRCANDILKVFK